MKGEKGCPMCRGAGEVSTYNRSKMTRGRKPCPVCRIIRERDRLKKLVNQQPYRAEVHPVYTKEFEEKWIKKMVVAYYCFDHDGVLEVANQMAAEIRKLSEQLKK